MLMKAKGGTKSTADKVKFLLQNEERMAGAAKKVLDIASSISNFDVGMSHISNQMINFAENLSCLSDSNLAIVEETTATMVNVTDTIDETAATLDQLKSDSDQLAERNKESKILLGEVSEIKENVLSDAQNMSDKTEQLISLVKEIGRMVESVQGIADQTNMLALNASIEAARAGEQGKGFAVVATQVKKLSEGTKQNLDEMREFMKNIYSAAEEGKSSVSRALDSTRAMGDKIDQVSVTVGDNIEMLRSVVSSVFTIHGSMQGIKESASAITQAMESSSEDAQKLANMTQEIYSDASESLSFAKNVGMIDKELSNVSMYLYAGLKSGDHAVTNEELEEVIRKAKKAHGDWLIKLQGIAHKMSVEPLQTNSEKCAFGHFYSVLPVEHKELEEDWKKIGVLHKRFHALGNDVLDAVKSKQEHQVEVKCNEAEKLSKEMMGLLDKVENKVRNLTKNSIRVFY